MTALPRKKKKNNNKDAIVLLGNVLGVPNNLKKSMRKPLNKVETLKGNAVLLCLLTSGEGSVSWMRRPIGSVVPLFLSVTQRLADSSDVLKFQHISYAAKAFPRKIPQQL